MTDPRDYRIGMAARAASQRVLMDGETPSEALDAVLSESDRLDLGPGERADAETAVARVTISVLERVSDRLADVPVEERGQA